MAAAEEAFGRFDVEGVIVHLSAAIRELTAAGDRRPAALACARLADVYSSYLVNHVAAAPWLARAERLLADESPCVEEGWVAVALMGCDVADPALLRERADLALDRARRFDDRELEIKALADGGLARVQAGEVPAGMAMLDEAMALACGDPGDVVLRSKSACSLYTACYYTADFERADAWSRLFRRAGLLEPRSGIGAVLTSHCDTVRAMMLVHCGRWAEAEAVLLAADSAVDAVVPGASWHPPIALADLRILQGRLDEAERLLLGRDASIQALLPLARLHLARGDVELAAATARRGLRLVAGDRLRAIGLLAVAVEADLARGDLAGAEAAVAELGARLGAQDLPGLRAEAARIEALVYVASGRVGEAAAVLRSAQAEVASRELPLLALRLHLALAGVLEAQQSAEATIEARAAAACAGELDVVLGTADAALLDRLTSGGRSPAGRRQLTTLSRDGAWWTVTDAAAIVRLRDTKGLRYVAALVAHPGVERHCFDLVDLVEGVEPGVDRRRLGDAGPAMDSAGRATLRREVERLRQAVEDALATGADDRAAALQAELDDVVGELARSFGLGGRPRRASAASERARLNVTRSIRTAVSTVAAALPAAGGALDRRVRTGTYCVYAPVPGDEIVWRSEVFSAD